MLTTLNTCIPAAGNKFLEITIQGTNIRLLFAAEANTESAALVQEVLKSSYLRRQGT